MTLVTLPQVVLEMLKFSLYGSGGNTSQGKELAFEKLFKFLTREELCVYRAV